MSKHNNFVKFLKKINLSINSLLENYLNKLKFKNLSNITGSNKILLIFVALIILFLSYLSIPHIYSKADIKRELENQLMNKFSLNFKFSDNINYKFFPRPHFIIEDSNILDNDMKISDIKKMRIFVSLDNLFSLKNIVIKDVILENSNFNLNNQNYKFFVKILDNNFLENSFSIKNSKIFFRNSDQEVLFINKIIDMKYYYDSKELKNIVKSENKMFNISYYFISNLDKVKKKIYSKINFNFLKFQIENEFNFADSQKKGLINLIFNKKKSEAFYELNKNFFDFKYFDRMTESNFIYDGKINFKPFYSVLKGKINKINLSNFFNHNSISTQLLKTEILNNKNLNIDINIVAKKIEQFRSIIGVFLNLKIQEGLIDIDNTKFSWENNVNFEIFESLIYVNNNQLILDGKFLIDVKNDDEIFKFLQMPKNLRPELKRLEFNFNYNFDQQIMTFNNIKVNEKVSAKVNDVLNKIILKKNNLQNKIYFKNIMKKAIEAYVG